jgi:hypothetical protein
MKTMLDKCAVAGDITQAIDRRGAWTCAIVIAGGTESTAVKLQSCDTADGSFSDFKTLIPASEAAADQYKGFVVDLDGAKKFIKVTGATMATCVLGDCDVDVKQVAIKAGEIPSGADLENNKTATIDVSAYTEPVEIEPTAGKDGMKKATVTLSNIPSPSGGSVTLYAWQGSFDGRYKTVFTSSANPQIGKKVLVPMNGSSVYFSLYTIVHVIDNTSIEISDSSSAISGTFLRFTDGDTTF